MTRPTTVTVFGILNLVFGTLGAVGVLLGAVVIVVARIASAREDLVTEALRTHPAYRTWVAVSLPIGFAAAVFLIVAGAGLLYMRPWARVGSIVYGIYGIVMGLANMGWNAAILLPIAAEAASRRGPEGAAALGGAIGTVLGGLIGLAYPVLLLVFMTRPRIVEAFRAGRIPPLSSS